MPTPPERMYTFHMNWAQYDFVIQALMEVPWRLANPILQNLNAQRIVQDEKYAKAEEATQPPKPGIVPSEAKEGKPNAKTPSK
jgi:hypothetical protein